MKRLLPLLVLATLVGGPIQGHAATQDYVAGSVGDVQSFCADELEGTVNVGGACFNFNSRKSSVTITVNDLLVSKVGFWFAQYDAAGDCATPDPDTGLCNLQGGFCHSQTLALAPSTRSIVVALDGPAFGPFDCPDTGGAATVGTIVANFS